MSSRRRASSASPYEDRFGFCRALRLGNTIAVAGTAPIGKNGETVAPGDPALQARRCFEIIAAALTELGGSLSDVTRTRIFLTRIEDWPEIGAVATMVEVSRLIDPDWRVEIEVDAILGGDLSRQLD